MVDTVFAHTALTTFRNARHRGGMVSKKFGFLLYKLVANNTFLGECFIQNRHDSVEELLRCLGLLNYLLTNMADLDVSATCTSWAGASALDYNIFAAIVTLSNLEKDCFHSFHLGLLNQTVRHSFVQWMQSDVPMWVQGITVVLSLSFVTHHGSLDESASDEESSMNMKIAPTIGVEIGDEDCYCTFLYGLAILGNNFVHSSKLKNVGGSSANQSVS